MKLTISDATGTSRFTTFTIDNVEEQYVRRTAGHLNSRGKRPKQFTVEGPGMIAALLDELDAVACIESATVTFMDLSNNIQALTTFDGELVTITADSGDCADRAETGFIYYDFSDNGGVHEHIIVIRFFPCDYLAINAGTLNLTWLPSIPS